MDVKKILDESLDLYDSNEAAKKVLGSGKKYFFERDLLTKAQESLSARVNILLEEISKTNTHIPRAIQDKILRFKNKKVFHLRKSRLRKKVSI